MGCVATPSPIERTRDESVCLVDHRPDVRGAGTSFEAKGNQLLAAAPNQAVLSADQPNPSAAQAHPTASAGQGAFTFPPPPSWQAR